MTESASAVRRAASSSSDRLLNAATIVVLLLVAATLIRSWVAPAAGAPPKPDPVAVGKTLNSLAVRGANDSTHEIALTGQPTIMYIFSTTCGICASQREAVRAWFPTLSGARILTVSTQPTTLTQSYWSDSLGGPSFAPPLRIAARSAKELHIGYVPYVIVTDAKGVVRLSHIGPFGEMDTAQVRSIISLR